MIADQQEIEEMLKVIRRLRKDMAVMLEAADACMKEPEVYRTNGGIILRTAIRYARRKEDPTP